MKPVRVLIIDDSASVRQAMTAILGEDPDIQVIAAAADPFAAARYIQEEVPDVITLDVEMPRMDGVTFLRKLMSQRPIPVVMCSSLVEEGSETLLQALEAGAVDVILKPRMGVAEHLNEAKLMIRETVKGAAKARLGARRQVRAASPAQKLTADAVLPPPTGRAMSRTTEMVVCIGASTGGTEALREVLEALPANSPGIVIVQHMPESFTRAFAKRLNGLCQVDVKEAEDGDTVMRGHVLIAPGGLRHTLLERQGARYVVSVKEGPLVSRHRPSVDVLFRSAARNAGSNAVGIIMTGMGDDGARGLLEMKQAGARTFAQDEATSVVFGMPKEAIARNAADKVIPLGNIARELLQATAR
ncbi:protein-glutamate methylesterase/protein-glutamine glutaminase [Sphingomonas aquatilis]|jgi:two-component system, chemotaxis family, protein-glutamate methylesterase/glutaminase|uniref:Protein-glutamate methylesterase/protein-glutamine glutaminase n=1 Tax=Sphingomonas aquatilis TaxID=93063 RepID=A0AAW3TT12_9SPHN|nr:chemotaxis response regulator protein-glutamate methylesterase [Sphingomonas aquatilis]MBB3875622.1 two-component system chemotaxis response regulator CheB [Sphingomonas aquatilis]MCI4655758.1 chemotaxis response regulator protein-glutamate methylesterase [Sphingomonas aquatilis]GEM73056.1 chemotaxis response regulator protein-glutamate methylesterase 2 [Sphingomonas aquatilis NBRC 16722]GKS02585.1 chemotaxis response regulator protein-glutamate methylesterase 2 [Sphingomonas aquatilis]